MKNSIAIFVSILIFTSMAHADDVANGTSREQVRKLKRSNQKDHTYKQLNECLYVSYLAHLNYQPNEGLYARMKKSSSVRTIVKTDGKYPGDSVELTEKGFLKIHTPCGGENKKACNETFTSDKSEIKKLKEETISRIESTFSTIDEQMIFYMKKSPYHKNIPFLTLDEVKDFKNSMCLCQDADIAYDAVEDAKKKMIKTKIKMKDDQGLREMTEEDFACDYAGA